MEESRKRKRSWPIAVAVSFGLHAYVLVGLESLSRSEAERTVGGPCDVAVSSVGDSGEIHFLQVAVPSIDIGPRWDEKTSVSPWPTVRAEDSDVVNVSFAVPSHDASA